MKLLPIALLLLTSTVSVQPQTSWQTPTHSRARRVDIPAKPKEISKPKEVVKAKTTTTKKEVEKLEHEWAKALLEENVTKLEMILSDDLQYTRSNGKVENKASYLKSIRDGITKYAIIKRSNTRIIIKVDTAIVTATWFAKLQNKPNPPLETTARYTHVYVKQDGRWQLTTHQSTEVK